MFSLTGEIDIFVKILIKNTLNTFCILNILSNLFSSTKALSAIVDLYKPSKVGG